MGLKNKPNEELDGLMEEAKKYKSAEEFIRKKQEERIDKFKIEDETIERVQSSRHEMHSIDVEHEFNVESS